MFGRIKKPMAAVALTAAVVVGGAGAAYATLAYVGGGTWSYGTGNGAVWSNYDHGTRCHSSSVQGVTFDRDTAPAGERSRAYAAARWYAVDHAYWNNAC